jgi:hypothetical protein
MNRQQAPLTVRLQRLQKIMAANDRLDKLRKDYNPIKNSFSKEDWEKVVSHASKLKGIIEENYKTTIFNVLPVEIMHEIAHKCDPASIKCLQKAIGDSGERIPYLYTTYSEGKQAQLLIDQLVNLRGQSKGFVDCYKALMNPRTLEYLYTGVIDLKNVLHWQKTKIYNECFHPCAECNRIIQDRDVPICLSCTSTLGVGHRYSTLTASQLWKKNRDYALFYVSLSSNKNEYVNTRLNEFIKLMTPEERYNAKLRALWSGIMIETEECALKMKKKIAAK